MSPLLILQPDYTANVCRNCPCAIIKFVELQVRTFSSFIIIFKQIFLDIELSKATCDKGRGPIKLCHCFVNQFVRDKFLVFILKSFFFWKDCSFSPWIIYWRDSIGFEEFFKYIVLYVTFIISQSYWSWIFKTGGTLFVVCIYLTCVSDVSLILLLLVSQSLWASGSSW